MATPASIPEDAVVSYRASLALCTALLLAAAASCSGTDSKSKNTGAGAGGDAAGQSSAMAGDDTGGVDTVDGDSTSGGDDTAPGGQTGAGGAATGSSEPFAIEGTVYAPKGGDVEGTVVIGCAWIDGECNEDKSQAVQVSKSGASGAYTLENLESGPTYLVLFWKDVNDSGEVDDDDYVGVVADESGAARAFTSAATDADAIMAIQKTVATTDVPDELVGDWFLVATSIGVTNAWTFAADGSANNTFTFNNSTCGGGAGTATSSQGVIAVDGDQLTFQPATGQKTVKPCSGASTTTDYYASPRHFTWRVGASTTQQGGTALFLISDQDPNHSEAEFQKL